MPAYVAVAERGGFVRAFRAVGRAGLAIAALMAVASGSFIIALNHASVANILFMQALSPVLAAVFGMLVGETGVRRTWVAMAVAIGGVGVMVGGPGRPHALGFGLSILMTTSFAATLVITRHRRDVSMAPATCLSQVLVLARRGAARASRDRRVCATVLLMSRSASGRSGSARVPHDRRAG